MPSTTGIATRADESNDVNVLVVVDDERTGRALVRAASAVPAASVSWCRSAAAAVRSLQVRQHHLVIAGGLGAEGLRLLQDTAATVEAPGPVFALLVAEEGAREGTRDGTREGTRTNAPAGVSALLRWPSDEGRLTALIVDAAAGAQPPRVAARAHATVAAARPGVETIVGRSPAIQALRGQVARIAGLPTDVLLIGETGAGKDLVSRRLHELSGRKGEYVALNCGAIPDTLFESELFGHQAGSFTGATKSTMGKIEQANGGTLFLDEIESMPMNQQVKMLRVLETRKVERVGARGEIDIDLRIIAATKEGLAERCAEGTFRSDLWHRLDVISLKIPALRDRREDIAMLFSGFLSEACERFGICESGLELPPFADLMGHDWPGNVRELRHAAERFALGMPALSTPSTAEAPSRHLSDLLGDYERQLIQSALARHGRDLRATARELGVSEKTLHRRLQGHGLARGRAAPLA